uniref:Uncharacterized protein n=1 Tax=Rhizophora mucronata TaxID=61149 RepID=A0A2P2NPA0_RHIMU
MLFTSTVQLLCIMPTAYLLSIILVGIDW